MKLKILFGLVAVYTIVNILVIRFIGGLSSYLLNIALWSTFFLATVVLSNIEDNINLFKWRLNREVLFNAILFGVIQVAVLILAGFYLGFGLSPYAPNPISMLLNILYFTTMLLGLEFSRAYLIEGFNRKRVYVIIVGISIIYTFLNIPLAKYISIYSTSGLIIFLGSVFLPSLAKNIFATFLVITGGPLASISYLGILYIFEFLSPILPDLPWTVNSLIAITIPIIGYLIINKDLSPVKLIQLGIIDKLDIRNWRRQLHSNISVITVVILTLLMIWSSLGLIGFKPNVIASGSMSPVLNVGDIAITMDVPHNEIKLGDIIRYWREGDPGPTIHRVVALDKHGNTIYIITKGDANDIPDDPIVATTKLSKVVLVIPEVGWISIYLKMALNILYNYLKSNLITLYMIFGLVIGGIIYNVYRYKNRPFKRLRRIRI